MGGIPRPWSWTTNTQHPPTPQNKTRTTGDGAPRCGFHGTLRPPEAHARAHHAGRRQVHRRVGPRPPGCVLSWELLCCVLGMIGLDAGIRTVGRTCMSTTQLNQTFPQKTNKNRPGGDPQAHRGHRRERLHPRGAPARARLPGPQGEVPPPGGAFSKAWMMWRNGVWTAFGMMGVVGSGHVRAKPPTTLRSSPYNTNTRPKTGQLRRRVADAEGGVRQVPGPRHRYHQVRAFDCVFALCWVEGDSMERSRRCIRTFIHTHTYTQYPNRTHPSPDKQLPDRAAAGVQGPHLHARRRGLARGQGPSIVPPVRTHSQCPAQEHVTASN